MAESTTKQTNNATKGKRATVKLRRLAGQNAIQEEFFSVNCRNYRIKRGERVEVPEELAEVIENAEKAEEYAMNYVSELVNAENEKKAEFGIK